jgi:hypothetical protein
MTVKLYFDAQVSSAQRRPASDVAQMPWHHLNSTVAATCERGGEHEAFYGQSVNFGDLRSFAIQTRFTGPAARNAPAVHRHFGPDHSFRHSCIFTPSFANQSLCLGRALLVANCDAALKCSGNMDFFLFLFLF